MGMAPSSDVEAQSPECDTSMFPIPFEILINLRHLFVSTRNLGKQGSADLKSTFL